MCREMLQIFLVYRDNFQQKLREVIKLTSLSDIFLLIRGVTLGQCFLHGILSLLGRKQTIYTRVLAPPISKLKAILALGNASCLRG